MYFDFVLYSVNLRSILAVERFTPLLLLTSQIRFIDNTDPAGIDHQIAQLGPEVATTLVIVISKVPNFPNFPYMPLSS
jgi:hypothetical protein